MRLSNPGKPFSDFFCCESSWCEFSIFILFFYYKCRLPACRPPLSCFGDSCRARVHVQPRAVCLPCKRCAERGLTTAPRRCAHRLAAVSFLLLGTRPAAAHGQESGKARERRNARTATHARTRSHAHARAQRRDVLATRSIRRPARASAHSLARVYY
jgi:hypothetical protein